MAWWTYFDFAGHRLPTTERVAIVQWMVGHRRSVGAVRRRRARLPAQHSLGIRRGAPPDEPGGNWVETAPPGLNHPIGVMTSDPPRVRLESGS